MGVPAPILIKQNYQKHFFQNSYIKFHATRIINIEGTGGNRYEHLSKTRFYHACDPQEHHRTEDVGLKLT